MSGAALTGTSAMLATGLFLAFASIAAVTDLLWNKIYNWNTYGGIATALASERLARPLAAGR